MCAFSFVTTPCALKQLFFGIARVHKVKLWKFTHALHIYIKGRYSPCLFSLKDKTHRTKARALKIRDCRLFSKRSCRGKKKNHYSRSKAMWVVCIKILTSDKKSGGVRLSFFSGFAPAFLHACIYMFAVHAAHRRQRERRALPRDECFHKKAAKYRWSRFDIVTDR